jgi:hypothetical protein
MAASSRHLDDWATALNVDNDDDAKLAVDHLLKKAMFISDAARLLTRMLADLPPVNHAIQVTRSIDDAFDSLGYVADGFDRHDRGVR